MPLLERKGLWLAMLLSLFLAACSTTPELDTANKRAYATELAVEGMLAQIDQYEREGRFTDDEWDGIVDLLQQLKVAHQAMHMALANGEDIGTNIAAVHTILVALRPYVEDSP